MISHNSQAYKLEEYVNDWVKAQFEKLSLKSQKDYYTESAIPDYLKEALKGRAKTENKTNFGKPDFSLTCTSKPQSLLRVNSDLKNSSPKQKTASSLTQNQSKTMP